MVDYREQMSESIGRRQWPHKVNVDVIKTTLGDTELSEGGLDVGLDLRCLASDALLGPDSYLFL